jgi:ubiquinone/menaquinone biosynthesis C-methylase UbiE
MKKDTSWGNVAKWYDELLEKSEGSFQKELILPNLMRLLEIRKGQKILDLACGQGFFARAFAKAGADVTGVDIAKELIVIAKEKSSFAKATEDKSPVPIEYHVAPADKMPFLKSGSFDTIVCVLAIQNIENMRGVFKECARALKPSGSFYFVLNHPAFRVPQHSDWGDDKAKGVQYRRVERYLSELKIPIQMHPGAKPSEKTVSFHRPLQSYSKALASTGFAITRMEEWNSHKKSQPGPNAKAEDTARKEIPLFLLLEAKKI